MTDTIPFIDLQAQRRRLGNNIDAAISRVLDHGQFIMGPEVAVLERNLAEFVGCKHVISCASGTDALLMALMVKGIGPGDAVFVPTFTFTATAEVISLLGATPVFIDVDEASFNIDPDSLASAIHAANDDTLLTPRGVIAVDMFGMAADYDSIHRIANLHGLWVISDAAQSLGGSRDGQNIGQLAEITCTSFFPAKPLGCYGDGGAIFTNSDHVAEILNSIRAHGKGTDKYDNVRIGINGRLDTLQAAVLIEKLTIFKDELVSRERIAQRYNSLLSQYAGTPSPTNSTTSAWAQYTIKVSDRDNLAAQLKSVGIPTAIYYPRPLHLQTAYSGCPISPSGCAISETLSQIVLSLPMHPYLDEETQDRIVHSVADCLERIQ